MKTLLSNLFAIFMLFFATTLEAKSIKTSNFNDIFKTLESPNDDWWWCYEINRVESEDLMTGETEVTTTYRCVWVEL
ncbi:hypothetical protein [Aestuariibaculum marinum]|uniref:Uncharacterized protein n=1 Tax=Aestuariibaculum marinum TaxID=2683592 RepID=A0A8J6PZ17_9FLAO|nr:hypothetical protein [Aestuariibaculum marinum]MBD0824611.1 hypothetical protein [Aestuariibaculum marinum]